MHALKVVFVAAILLVVDAVSIDHDKVQPFAQPEPVTLSEKLGVKYKPTMDDEEGCAVFPAVNAAGETNGGLKGSGGTTGCREAPLGAQVYGRSMWYEGKYAILYAWYFPKGFSADWPVRRHDWASAVVWLDDPEAASPTVSGLSYSTSDTKYDKEAPPSGNNACLASVNGGPYVTMVLEHAMPFFLGTMYLRCSGGGGDYDLIMWEQLTDAARMALNTADFGEAEVPFNDVNFEKRLKKAWPY